MSDTSSDVDLSGKTEEIQKRKINKVVLFAAIGLVVVAILGVFFVFQFIQSERQRDRQAWQIRLGIVADSRSAAVEDWLDTQFGTMRELSENASLQLYMTELSLAGGNESEVTDEPAQASYLRNLLVATAERAGFTEPFVQTEITANVERVGTAGIGLTDAAGRPLVATPTMPPLTGKLRDFINKMPRGERALFDLHLGVSDQPTLGFVVPVFGIQADEGTSEVIGLVIGLRIVGQDLYDTLKQPGETDETAETYLVRRSGANIEYLSPLQDGTPPLRRVLMSDTPGLAAAYVVENAGGFAIKRDYGSEEVLVTGRPISLAPWTLVRKVTTQEALAGTESRLTTMLVVFLLLIVGVSIALIAVWRHGTSLRATASAERFRVAAERFQNLGKFLRVLTDSQLAEIVAVSEEGAYTFANKSAGDAAGIASEDMLGKTMSGVVGPVRAKTYLDINRDIIRNTEEILANSERITHVHRFDDERGTQLFRSVHYPLRGDRDHTPAVLMILDDITELMEEREKKERVFQQLVETLVHLLGQRDPWSAHHAARVMDVARAIARELELKDNDLRAVEFSAQLMNLGKILVPPDLLIKRETLTEDELRRVRESILTSAELLEEVDFDGPVAETIRQLQEHWDGSGQPRGLKEEEILLSARIIAVANAFVAMVSARSFRDGGLPPISGPALKLEFGAG